MTLPTYLDVFREYIGEEPTDERMRISDWPSKHLQHLEDVIADFELEWHPPDDEILTVGVFQCHDLMKLGLRRATQGQGRYRFGITWDIDYLSKLLLFYPRIAISLPDYPTFSWRFEGDLRHLLALKPLVESGAVLPIPASYLKRVVGWDDETRISVASRLAERDAMDSDIINALKRFRPFDDRGSVNEERYDFEWANNRKYIEVGDPLRTLNEDMILATATNAEILCPNHTMFSLMSAKLGSEYNLPLHDIWAATICFLPNATDLKVLDIASIRSNEELFAEWRARLTDSLRQIRLEVEAGRALRGSEKIEIIKQNLSECAAVLADKVKESRLKRHFENASASFAIGATAAFFISSSPTTSVGTGALSSILRFVYDAVKKRPPKHHELYLHMYTMFGVSRK